jgi:tetratricopeptide (TPR) repeat protein
MDTVDFKDLLHQGICAYQKNEYEIALQCFEKLQQLYPDEKIASYSLVVALEALGRWNEAETLMKKVAVAHPDFPDAFHHLGYITASQGKFDIARNYYIQTIAIEPENINAHYNLGVMQKLLGFADEAQQSFKNALAIDPDYIFARQHLVTKYLAEEKFELAKKELDLCISISPCDPLIHATYASFYLQTGDFEKAFHSIEEALLLDENNSSYQLKKAELLYMTKNYQESINIASKIAELHPDFVECFELLGDNYLALYRLEEAKVVYAKALSLEPELSRTCKGIQQLFPDITD